MRDFLVILCVATVFALTPKIGRLIDRLSGGGARVEEPTSERTDDARPRMRPREDARADASSESAKRE